jgi:uncharacterized membrane protein YGL010W
MRNLEQHITQYAAYHRDRRNIATHFVGVPTIVCSVVLALVPFEAAGISLAIIGILLASLYYMALDRPLGVAMAVFLLACYAMSQLVHTSLGGAGTVVLVALALFVIGWIIQFVGHKFEGMKPAFTDDLMGLVIGPLFIMTEVFFMLGLKQQLKQYVEARVGPTLAARDGAPIGPSNA